MMSWTIVNSRQSARLPGPRIIGRWQLRRLRSRVRCTTTMIKMGIETPETERIVIPKPEPVRVPSSEPRKAPSEEPIPAGVDH